MPRIFSIKAYLLDKANQGIYSRGCVSCLVLSKEGKIILQQRDIDCERFPGCLGTFGGGIERNESPMQALVRELKEELGAQVKPSEVIELGLLTEDEKNHRELVYLYFWHDRLGSITGCYEGKAKYYNHSDEAKRHPKLMEDAMWLLDECKDRRLLL